MEKARKSPASQEFWSKYYPGFGGWLNPLDAFWDGLTDSTPKKESGGASNEELPPECRTVDENASSGSAARPDETEPKSTASD